MSDETTTPKVWPLPVAITLTVVIFTATFYVIAEGVRLQEKKGIWPIAVGMTLFALLMLALSAVTFRKDGKWRVGLSITVVLAETAVFTYCLFFLLLNIYGS
jgi:hypothetical protein